jgi:hypothetical protein
VAIFPDAVETDRLRLHRLTAEEIAPLDLYEHCSAPEMERVTRYLPWDPTGRRGRRQSSSTK